MALAAGLDKPEAIEAFLQEGPGTLPDVDPGAVQAAMAQEFARTVLTSGFPVPETLEEFRTLVAAPLLHGPPQPHTAAHVTRTQRTRPKRPRRH